MISIFHIEWNKFFKIKVVLYLPLLFFFKIETFSQTLNIKGNVYTSKASVHLASVTFINNADTSKKYSTLTDSTGKFSISVVTNVLSQPSSTVPQSIELAQNYPNPFFYITAISYELKKQTEVEVAIYDILGREIKTFKVGLQLAGTHGVQWNGMNNLDKKVSPGIYFYQMKAGNETQAKKMIYMSGNAMIKTPFINGFSPTIRKVEKKGTRLAGSEIFTVRIRDNINSAPKISNREFYDVDIRQDTTLNFIVREATHYQMNLYVGNYGYDQIFVVDTDSDTLIDTLTGFRSVGNVIPTKNGKKLYVTTTKYSVYPHDTTYPATVYSVDYATRIKKEILLRRAMIRLTPNGIPFIIASTTMSDTSLGVDTMRAVGIIDTVTDAISFIDTLNIIADNLYDGGNQWLVFHPNEPVFYSWTNQHQLFAYNYLDKKMLRYYSSLNYPYHITISKDGKFIYCANGPVLDLANDSIVGWVPGNNIGLSGSLALSPDGKYLYLTDPGKYIIFEPPPSGKIKIFDAKSDGSMTYINFINVNKASGRVSTITDKMVIMFDGEKGYVTDSVAKIFVLDIETNEVANIIRFTPRNISLRPLSFGLK